VLGFGGKYLSGPSDGKWLEGYGTSKKLYNPATRQCVFLCVIMDHCASNGENKKYLQHFGV
jgi:hypothetical protein